MKKKEAVFIIVENLHTSIEGLQTTIAKTTETIGSLNRLQTAAVTLYGRKREND